MTEAAGEGSPPVYRVALIPGDGVGPEVIAGAVSVLEAVGRRFGFGFAWDELIVGGAGIDAYGVAIRPEDVEVGRHGLLIGYGGRRGVLLPQVPVEHGWDRETFLAHTCWKAGLPEDTWRKPGVELFGFTATVFSEDS